MASDDFDFPATASTAFVAASEEQTGSVLEPYIYTQ
jgi:hypothetical protein